MGRALENAKRYSYRDVLPLLPPKRRTARGNDRLKRSALYLMKADA